MGLAVVIACATGAARADNLADTTYGGFIREQFSVWQHALADGDTSAVERVFGPARLSVAGGLGLQDEVVPAGLASELFGNVTIAFDLTDVQVFPLADARSMLFVFTAKVTKTDEHGTARPVVVRGSELAEIVQPRKEFRLIAGQLSIGYADAAANAAAKAGKGGGLQPVTDTTAGPAAGLEAFAALMKTGFDPASAKAATSVFIGSGPGEQTHGGASLAGYFGRAWAGKAKVVGPVLAIAAGSGDSVAVIANASLPGGTAKAPYGLPFRMFVVFTRAHGDPSWTLMHVHFAVPWPG
jgi:hypothetical protein